MEMVLDVLERGLLLRTPEPNVALGTLECQMSRYCAGRNIGVVVALSDEDPDIVVVTAMEI